MNLARITTMLCMTALAAAGCTTVGTFRVPEGTQLYVYQRPTPVAVEKDGKVETAPFFWTAMGLPPGGGIPYRLEKDGKVVKEGRLRAKFRVVSIFWPPFALIYWPTGFNPDVTYDLVNDKQE